MNDRSAETTVVELNIDDIKPNPANPKKHFDEGIEESIKDKGYIELVVVDEKNTLLAGEGRWRALKKLGHKRIRAIRKEGLTRKQKLEYLLISNKLVERGGWDEEILKKMGVDTLLRGGFIEEELSTLWDDVLSLEEDEFDVEKAVREIKIPNSKRGELYQLGDHRLMVGSATNLEDVKKLAGKNKVDVIYSDPPYNIGLDYSKGIGTNHKYGGKYSAKNDKQKPKAYWEFINKSIVNSLAVTKKDAHIFYWCDESFIGKMQNIYESNKIINRRVCIWIKNNQNPTPQVAFNKVYEPCVYGTVGTPYLRKGITNLNEVLNREVESGNQMIDEILSIINIWLVKRDPSQSYEHPTQKPISLHEKPLKRCSKPNDVVMDLFGGSGSTLVACEQLGRRCFMEEFDPIFVDVIIKRWETYTGKKAKLINGESRGQK